MNIKNKITQFFEKITTDLLSQKKEIKTKYGISGTSIYADHDEVKKLAIQDLKELQSIMEPKSKEEITTHLIYLQKYAYEIRKEIEVFQEKLKNCKE